MKYVIDLFSILYEAYLFSVFFRTLERRERLKRFYRSAFYALFIIAMGVLYYFVPNAWIRLAALIVFTVALSFIYDIQSARRMIGILFFILLLTLCELLTGFILSAIFTDTVAEISQSIVYYTAGVIVSKSLALLGIKMFQYTHKKSDIRLSPSFVVAICVFPFTSLVVSIILIGGYGANMVSSIAVLGALAIILLSAANIIVYILFERFVKEQGEKSELALEQTKLRLESEYLKDLVERQTKAGKAMHDLKNQLFAIRQLLKDDYGAGRHKIDEICDAVNVFQNAVYTGESEIDALINSKVRALTGIEFSCECYISGFGDIDRIDLCVVLGNLLDNAAEACAKAGGGKIRLKFLQHGNMLNIILSNTFAGEIEIKDSVPETSKENALAHGFGLKSVKSIVQKYKGDMRICAENGQFIVSVLLTIN